MATCNFNLFCTRESYLYAIILIGISLARSILNNGSGKSLRGNGHRKCWERKNSAEHL